MKNFKDKVVVVTGAGSGMGQAYTLAFAKLGAKLAICDRNQHGLKETVGLLRGQGVQAFHAQIVDMSNRDEVLGFANNTQQDLGNAAVVINNAGIEGCAAPSWATSISDIEKVMAVNFYGVVNGTQAFLPQLQQSEEAALVNVSSIFGLIGTPNHSDYCASKFAVRGYTEAMMAELSDSHVQVHLLHPGGIATNISQQDKSQAFSDHFLSTPPEKIVQHVIQSIRKNRARIVYGNRAQSTWLGARIVPLGLLSKIIWHQMKNVVDRNHYQQATSSKNA
ncbi:MAG: SDR family NAD(P)-dependent oxidoreductase [Pseudomonadales bacterium]|nr:SDR family NAD(P)-dependent oxidoreductase [Pseudomonadales bacterium]